MAKRVVVLGFDSLDWILANEWMAAGRLPFLQGVVEESHKRIYDECNRALPGSAWTNMATGVSAGVHGFVHSRQLRPGSYEWERIDSSHVNAKPFYKELSDAGVRCAVVDLPVDHPLQDFNGIQVIDWGTEFKLWHFDTRPAAYSKTLLSHYGEHPLTHHHKTQIDLRSLRALKAKLAHGMEMKRQLACELLAQREYGFVFIGFGELHKAGHFFWRFHDRAHPDFTDEEPELVDSLRDAYVQMDNVLGSVMKHVRDDDNLIVFSDRGMQPEYRGDHLVDEFLMRLEFAVPQGTLPSAGARRSTRAKLWAAFPAKRAFRTAARRGLPHSLREAVRPLYHSTIGALPPLNWARTRAFRLPSVGNSYLRINLEGRDPQGAVGRGAEYDSFLRRIDAELRALRNTDTGAAVVDDVRFPGRELSGPRSDEIPDVAILWSAAAPIRGICSDAAGVIEGVSDARRSGNHRHAGFGLLRGPSLQGGTETADGDPRELAPTILELFGIDAPPHYEIQPSAKVCGSSRSTSQHTQPM